MMKIPKLETIVILCFFGAVALWMVSKCSSKRSELARREKDLQEDMEDRELRRSRDSVRYQQPATAPVTQTQPVAVQPATQPAAQPSAQPSAQPQMQAHPGEAMPAPQKTPRPTVENNVKTTAAAPASPTDKLSKLYVTIDGLKVRKEPGLKGATVAKLELYEPVYFLNQKTEWTQEISLGYEKVTDHWVKIRTASGKEGWVFGAGVHYYKMKRKGVMEN